MKLLVLIVRGLQAAATGPYGNRWNDTFTLDALAAQGVTYDWHFAAHPEPEAARRVWRTGRYGLDLAPLGRGAGGEGQATSPQGDPHPQDRRPPTPNPSPRGGGGYAVR